MADKPLEMWAVLELMGHRRLAGLVMEANAFGTTLVRIDVPGPDGSMATQFYSPTALFSVTPVAEDIARAIAQQTGVAPVHRWEIPQLAAAADADVPF